MSADEFDLLKWPDPLPSSWAAGEIPAPDGWLKAWSVTQDGAPRGEVRAAFVAATRLAATYPVGVRDRFVEPSADATAEALQLVSERIMAEDPACRRLVLATAEGDLNAIARGEAAGYRYVVDVDVPGESLSLLAAEPAWVLEESRHLDDVPTH
jgi:hypothetical protein